MDDREAYYKSGKHLFRSVIRHAQMEASGEIEPICVLRSDTKEELRFDAWCWLICDTPDLRIAYHFSRLEEDTGHSFDEFLEMMRERFMED